MTVSCNVVPTEIWVSTAVVLYYSICTVEVVRKELLITKERRGAATYSAWTYRSWHRLGDGLWSSILSNSYLKPYGFWISNVSRIMSLVHLWWLFASWVEETNHNFCLWFWALCFAIATQTQQGIWKQNHANTLKYLMLLKFGHFY